MNSPLRWLFQTCMSIIFSLCILHHSIVDHILDGIIWAMTGDIFCFVSNSTICLPCHQLLSTVSSLCLSLLNSKLVFLQQLKVVYILPLALGKFLNPSQCLWHMFHQEDNTESVKHGWMYRTHTLSTRLLITKSSIVDIFHFSGKNFSRQAAVDEWQRMRCSQDPGNKRTPDTHSAVLNIVHWTWCKLNIRYPTLCSRVTSPHQIPTHHCLTLYTTHFANKDFTLHIRLHTSSPYTLYCALHTAHYTLPIGQQHSVYAVHCHVSLFSMSALTL